MSSEWEGYHQEMATLKEDPLTLLGDLREHIESLEARVCTCHSSGDVRGSGTRLDPLELIESDEEVPESDDSYVDPPVGDEDEELEYAHEDAGHWMDAPLPVLGPEHRRSVPCPPTPHVSGGFVQRVQQTDHFS
jgi:hypothetical protein